MRGKAEYHDSTCDYSVAKDDLQKAVELDDTVPDYNFYFARTLYEISIGSTDNTDSDEAIQKALVYINSAIKKYTEDEGNSDEEAENETESDAEAGADDESADELNSANQDKTLAEYYYYAGLINNFMDPDESWNEIVRNYRNATIYDSGNAEYFSQLGIAYYRRDTSDDLAKAEAAFERAISIDETDLDYYNEGFHLAWKAHVIEEDETRIDEAIAVYEESLKCRVDYAYSYKKLAELYKVKEDDESVKSIYSRAINNCTDNAEFYYEYGLMHYSESDFNQTITDMEWARESDSSYTADACYYIGCSYHRLAVYEEAYKYYQLAKDNGSDRSDIDEYMETCREYMGE